MKKYEYVNIKLQNNYVANAVLAEHRKIINEMSQKGYEYAGFVPSKQGPSGKIVEIDLIFQTEI